jgi:hypothetical protein
LRFGERLRAKLSTVVTCEPEVFDNRFREGFIELHIRRKALGQASKSIVHLGPVLFELGFEVLLKVGNVLLHSSKNAFEVTLEFSSETKFEFFTIHWGFSSKS